MNRTIMWGSLELIHVILDFGAGTANIVTWHFGHQKLMIACSTPLQQNNSFHWNR